MPPASGSTLSNAVRLLRPRQWVKNFFVLAPLIFARELFDVAPLLTALKALISFSLAASTVYILNDLSDVEADRAHPEKKQRPVASGAVSPAAAKAIAVVLALLLIALLMTMEVKFIAAVALYIVLNVAYSLKLKEVVLLDVFVIAAGFMLRVLGGAYAISVEVSSWIVLCTLFISLLLGFAKRRAELLLTEDNATSSQQRKVLEHYRVAFIDQMLTLAAAGTVISYALYTVAPRTLEIFGTDKMMYTTVFVMYGVFRYLYLAHTARSTENPTNVVLTDPGILVTGVLWIVSCVFLIYAGGKIV